MMRTRGRDFDEEGNVNPLATEAVKGRNAEAFAACCRNFRRVKFIATPSMNRPWSGFTQNRTIAALERKFTIESDPGNSLPLIANSLHNEVNKREL